jgi:F420-dependent oxidoreductase-like protein
MRLGVNVSQPDAVRLAREAERLDFDAVYVPEGVRGDAVSVLGMVAGATTRIGLGAGVMEIPARTPAMTALTAATLDALSQGRFRLGLGVTNTYISEDWHGVPFHPPLARTREYVEIVRAALRREPVTHAGRHYQLPLVAGRGDPFRLVTPGRIDLPIYLAAIGARSLQLAGEVADGWFGVFCSPDRVAWAVDQLRIGHARRRRTPTHFEVALSVPLVVDPDPVAAGAPVRRYVARFVSLGPPEHNFYHRLLVDAGFGKAADEIVRQYRAGEAERAAAAVPSDFLAGTSLLGPTEHIATRLKAYRDAGVDTLAVSPFHPDPARRLADLRAVAGALAAVVPVAPGRR